LTAGDSDKLVRKRSAKMSF